MKGYVIDALLSPLWHGVALARSATTGNFEPLASLVHIVVLFACVGAGSYAGTRTFTRRLTG